MPSRGGEKPPLWWISVADDGNLPFTNGCHSCHRLPAKVDANHFCLHPFRLLRLLPFAKMWHDVFMDSILNSPAAVARHLLTTETTPRGIASAIVECGAVRLRNHISDTNYNELLKSSIEVYSTPLYIILEMFAPASMVIFEILAIEFSCSVSTVAPALILMVGAYLAEY